MAAYTGTPTILQQWEEGDRFGKRVRVVKRLSLSLSSQGGTSDTISASALGFLADSLSRAVCILFTDGSSNKRAVGCFTDGTYLYIADPTQATDANRGLPANVTGTLIVEVAGQPAN